MSFKDIYNNTKAFRDQCEQILVLLRELSAEKSKRGDQVKFFRAFGNKFIRNIDKIIDNVNNKIIYMKQGLIRLGFSNLEMGEDPSSNVFEILKNQLHKKQRQIKISFVNRKQRLSEQKISLGFQNQQIRRMISMLEENAADNSRQYQVLSRRVGLPSAMFSNDLQKKDALTGQLRKNQFKEKNLTKQISEMGLNLENKLNQAKAKYDKKVRLVENLNLNKVGLLKRIVNEADSLKEYASTLHVHHTQDLIDSSPDLNSKIGILNKLIRRSELDISSLGNLPDSPDKVFIKDKNGEIKRKIVEVRSTLEGGRKVYKNKNLDYIFETLQNIIHDITCERGAKSFSERANNLVQAVDEIISWINSFWEISGVRHTGKKTSRNGKNIPGKQFVKPTYEVISLLK